ncbi:MAG: hypothetical protein GX889_12950 [Clostridiales bacterium]|nr:hypothetical protein [Clostridiales bacterium]
MWNITYDLNRLIPPLKSGYNFIKSIKLYIPYKEIGLKTLIRKEQPLPFFYEIILKLVDCKYNEIYNISELTGVEEEILNDVVGEMSGLDLLYIKSNIITLTPKGKESLNNLKKTVIEKEELNRIYINAITGEIKDLERTYKKPAYMSPCLDEKIKITDEFITNHFSDFNEYYQKRQEDYEVKEQHNNIRNEIYQIIGKEYEKLCYIEERAFVYKNIRDNDLLFECENDPENIYGNTLAKQVYDCTGARRFLVAPFNCAKYLGIQVGIDSEKKENTEKLIQVLSNNATLDNKNKEEIEEYYFVDRYLLENEYYDILTSLKNIKPSEVIISSGKLSEILDYDVITALQTILNKTKIYIICDKNEYKISQLKSKVMNYMQKKRSRIKWIEQENITQTNIILYPQCLINIKYNPIPVGKDYLIQEIPEITFDKEKIRIQKDKLLSLK